MIVDIHRDVPIEFGDESSRDAYIADVRRALAAMRARGVRYAVAPRIRLPLPDGRVLEPSVEVTAEMLGERGRAELNKCIQSGHVLEAEA